MTPEQFKKLLKQKQKEINHAFSRTLPVKVGTEAVKFVRENFRQEGFVDSKVEKWKPAKRKSNPKHPDQAYGTLLSRRNRLYRSVSKRASPGKAVVYTNVPYAAAHNEGTNNAGRGRKTKIPKRQFIGPSKVLNERAKGVITKELKKILND